METLVDTPVLEFCPDTLQVVRKLYDLDKPGAMSNALDILEEWVKQQRHFVKKDFDRKFLEIAIIQNKGSIERAKRRLDRMCTFRTLTPSFFGDFNVWTDFHDLDGCLKVALMPKLTDDHNRVSIVKYIGSKFTSNFMMDYLRLVFMYVEYLKTCDYVQSYIIITDYRDTNIMEFVPKLNITEFQQGMTIVTEAYGVRMKAIHIISPSKLISSIVSIFKQVTSEKIGNRVMVHKDLQSLYQHVPKDVLPEDYGGRQKSLDVLYENWKKELGSEDYRQYLKDMSEAKTDESLRPRDVFNYEYLGMPGTFRTLTVD